ncbi:sensor histidine kinase [Methanofollis ethanolicus]|uniref:sensor histidine kinase n=1 Tax=Methanofollis ethanolicus TaxID=488124 RepID=UPI0008359013|nr:PAS domain-containing sensor histidine kinase [Methanofollis ethanolicus]
MEGISEPRRQLATLMSNLPGMVYRCRNDPAYPMEFVSEGAYDLLGYPPADLTGGDVMYGSLIHKEDRDHVWKEIQEAVRTGGPFRATYRVKTASGRERWVWEQGRGVFDEKGRLVALEGFIADITRQVELQEDLRQRELQQKAILDNIPDIAWLKDGDGRFVAVNRAFETSTGRAAGEVIGKTDAAVWPPDIAAKHQAEDEMVMTSGRRISIVEPLRRADGSERWVETIKTPVADGAGRAAGTAGISRDITDRKVMEAALRESEERYRLFLQNFPGIAFRTDADLNPVFLHGNVEGVTGYSAGEILARTEKGDTIIQPADREAYAVCFQGALTTGMPAAADIRILRKDGEGRWLHLQAQPVPGPDGRPTGVQGAAYDITKRIQAEEEIRNLAKFPEENPGPVIRVSGTGRVLYANGASKILLETWGTGVDGIIPESWQEIVAETLETGRKRSRDAAADGTDYTLTCVPVAEGGYANLYGVDITERKAMECAAQEANRKLNLLNSIIRHDLLNQITVLQGYLELSGLGDTAFPYLGRLVETSERLRRLAEFTRDYQELGVRGPTWQAVGEGIRHAFTQRSPRGIAFEAEIDPALHILADPLLERVFYNLVDNTAVHGEDATRIRFGVAMAESGITLIYEDNGIGVPAVDKEEIFRRGAGKHSGLGLFLSREILSLTGLAIRETGVPGEGVRFEIAVPKGRYRYAKTAPDRQPFCDAGR